MQTFDFRGSRFAYRIVGSGPPLVMIQAVGAHGTSWNPVIEILKKHYTCLTFDNRGIGASQPAGMQLSVDQMAEDTLALMDHVEWKSAHLVGHSLGGLIALQIALKAKPRVPPEETRFKPDELTSKISRVLGHHIADLPSIADEQTAAMSAHDVTVRLGEFSGIPTLVISGEKDPIARPNLHRGPDEAKLEM